jgi:hypothetical protein
MDLGAADAVLPAVDDRLSQPCIATDWPSNIQLSARMATGPGDKGERGIVGPARSLGV